MRKPQGNLGGGFAGVTGIPLPSDGLLDRG